MTTANRTVTDHPILTKGDLAKRLQCTQRHVQNLNAQGRIPSPIKLGRCVRWSAVEIDNWAAAGCPIRDLWETMKAEASGQ